MINDWVVAIAFLMVILVLVIIAIIIGLKAPPYQPTRHEKYENYYIVQNGVEGVIGRLCLEIIKVLNVELGINFRFIILVISI